jgi:hypothetical protein
MVEAQQARVSEFGEAGLVDIASDATRMQMRRMVERLTDQRCLVSGFCSSGRDFAPRFLQTVPRGSALALC